jgi:DNA-binding beta-propeller fold protein YncE
VVFHSNRRLGGSGRFSVAPRVVALVVGAALCLVSAVVAGTPGTAGDATADRELGQTDFIHTMFDFGGAAALSGPAGVAVDAAGHLYAADSINNRILGWSSVSGFGNGDPANLVIGRIFTVSVATTVLRTMT